MSFSDYSSWVIVFLQFPIWGFRHSNESPLKHFTSCRLNRLLAPDPPTWNFLHTYAMQIHPHNPHLQSEQWLILYHAGHLWSLFTWFCATLTHLLKKKTLLTCYVRFGECDFTKYNMFLDQHPCWPRNNIPINQSELRDNFSENICFSLTIRARCFYITVNQLQFPTDFRNTLWLGLGIGLSLYFWPVMLI